MSIKTHINEDGTMTFTIRGRSISAYDINQERPLYDTDEDPDRPHGRLNISDREFFAAYRVLAALPLAEHIRACGQEPCQ